MSTASKNPVLIAGSGPSGLILALTLSKNGVPVRVIEKDSQYHLGQRGSGLQPRTLELLNYIGVLPDVLNGGSLLHRRAIYEVPGGRKVLKVIDMSPYEEPTPSVPFRNPWIIGQSHHEEILRSHLAQYGVHVELNTELASFEQTAEGVTAQLVKRNGAEETQETVVTEWLIGADGARSAVRKGLGYTFEGETRPADRIIIGDIEIEGLDEEYWHSWGDAQSGTVYLRPTEYPGRFSVMIYGRSLNHDELMSSKDKIYEFIKWRTGRDELVFKSMGYLSEWRPNIRMANKFGEGRVYIVGDAAHVHPPTGGQGLNSGAQDAFNLAWKLTLAYKGLAAPSLLDSYTPERLPIIAEMLGRTTAILNTTIQFKADGSNAKSHERPQVLHQLGVNVRWSPIVLDEQPEAATDDVKTAGPYLLEDTSVLYAGDRAPDAPGLVPSEGEATSLFKIFGPTHHTVLLFDEEQATGVFEVLAQYPKDAFTKVVIRPQGSGPAPIPTGADLVVTDSDGHARQFYPPTTKGFPVVIVRPDGVVGAVVRGKEGAKQYFERIFA